MRKTIKTPAANEQWKDNFRSSAMKIGFSLHLSRSMLEYLCAVADDVQWDAHIYRFGSSKPENWIASQKSLEKRGLIQRKPDEFFKTGFLHKIEFGEWNAMELTPAGELVVSLLKTAGMFVEADAAINKKSRRA